MTLICEGALIAGLLAALVLPFLPFAAGLSAAILIGTVFALVQERPVGDTLLVALAVLIACQVGYGLGLVSMAILRSQLQARRSKNRRGERGPREGLHPERD